ncbi:MAG: reverse transcriptase family protein [Planctomycetota bacterium]|jgi:retron-type reverse transcriptase
MALFGLFGGRGHDVAELARRLGVSEDELRSITPAYREFTVPKRRSAARRTLLAPDDRLKAVQRRINRRVLALLVSHRCVHGFERGRSIVTNALPHLRQAVVVRMDIRDFFTSTAAARVKDFYRKIGWNREAATLLAKLTTYAGGLPQGAPTSPRLANLVNYRMDTRLDRFALSVGATYTRYADDLTFSFADDPGGRRVRHLVQIVGRIALDEHYVVHKRRKLHVRRKHQQQRVTGLVVNDRVNLPRRTRRWLRAVEHRLAEGRPATIEPSAVAGWRALASMVAKQR